MRYLRRGAGTIAALIVGSSSGPNASANRSSASAILSRASTILSSRSATFSIGLGSLMSRILSLGTAKNNSPCYVVLAGGNA